MHALLQTIGAILVLPYLGLAGLFLLIGEAARTRSLLELIDVVIHHASWLVRWGIYGFPLLWLCLVLTGFFAGAQRFGALCLCLLALGSIVVIVALHTPRMGLGELTFLVPCVAVAAASAWLFVRDGGLIGP